MVTVARGAKGGICAGELTRDASDGARVEQEMSLDIELSLWNEYDLSEVTR